MEQRKRGGGFLVSWHSESTSPYCYSVQRDLQDLKGKRHGKKCTRQETICVKQYFILFFEGDFRM